MLGFDPGHESSGVLYVTLLMDENLKGKSVLVTGGARRVGAAICRRLHAAGANLIVHYRHSADAASALQSELNGQRAGSVALVQCDLLDSPQLSRMVEFAARHFAGLDVLVNNASSFFPTPVGEINEAAWNDLVGANLKAPLFLSQAAAPHLKARGGCIVNIVDIHAERPLKNHVVYSIAKAGLAALTRSLAIELGPEIRVNGVAPGTIVWPEDPLWADPQSRLAIVNQTPLKRVGDPDDIARAVQFLAVAAPYVTGQIIAVDGGRSVAL